MSSMLRIPRNSYCNKESINIPARTIAVKPHIKSQKIKRFFFFNPSPSQQKEMKVQLLKLGWAHEVRSFTPAALPKDRISHDSPTKHLPPWDTSLPKALLPLLPPAQRKKHKWLRLIKCINKHLLHLPRQYTSVQSAQIHHLACSSSAGGYTGHSILCKFRCSFCTLLCSYLVTDQCLAPKVIKLQMNDSLRH